MQARPRSLKWRIAPPVFAVPALAALALTACSGPNSLQQARAGIDQFHERLDAGQYDAILADADPGLTSGSSPAKIAAFLTAEHARLGKVQGTTRHNWRVNYDPSGTFTLLNMTTRFEHGVGDEEFTFRAAGDQLKLSGHQLIIKDGRGK